MRKGTRKSILACHACRFSWTEMSQVCQTHRSVFSILSYCRFFKPFPTFFHRRLQFWWRWKTITSGGARLMSKRKRCADDLMERCVQQRAPRKRSQGTISMSFFVQNCSWTCAHWCVLHARCMQMHKLARTRSRVRGDEDRRTNWFCTVFCTVVRPISFWLPLTPFTSFEKCLKCLRWLEALSRDY